MTPKPSIVEYATRLGALIGQIDPARVRPGQPPPVLGEDGFNDLALDLFERQLHHNPVYARYCWQRAKRSVSHWTEIPAMPVVAFKEMKVTCLNPDERCLVFHSSGTTGQKPARHFHHQDSVALYEASLWSWFQAHCGPGLTEHRLIFLTPPAAAVPHSSLVHMFETIAVQAGSPAVAFAGRVLPGTNSWAIDPAALRSLLRSAVNSGQPVALLGTAVHFAHLVEVLAEQDERLALPPTSWVFETGGYKGQSRSMPLSALRAAISERLGIPAFWIVGEYGMCELSSQAYDRILPAGSGSDSSSLYKSVFRFPPWTRVRIINPETGRVAAAGEPGLICVWDLANAWSVLAVQTEDLGAWCGDGFALLGRAPQAEPRGCSLQAG
jgi:hypothetical protein